MKTILILILIGITAAGITLLQNAAATSPEKQNFNFSIDSVQQEIIASGWNDALLDNYSFYLLNSEVNFPEETDRINTLPHGFQKTYLAALLLKKQGRFSEMFDSLITLLPALPPYLKLYDELVFSSNAGEKLTLLEDKISKSKLPALYKNYTAGLINSAAGKYAESAELFLEALKEDTTNYIVLYQLSYAYRNAGDYQTALKYLNDAKIYAAGDQIFFNKLIIAEGTLHFLSGDYKKAQQLYTSALSSAQKINDKQNEITALVNLGIIYDLNGDTDKARNNFFKGLSIAENINDFESRAFALSELGVSYTFTGEMIDAKNNYLRSYATYELINDRLRLSLLSENLGKIFVYISDYETALQYYEKGFEYAGDNKHAMAVNLVGMADVYANLSNYSKALRLYKQAEEISAQIKEISLEVQVINGLGSLNFNLNRYPKALEYFHYSVSLSDSTGDVYSFADAAYKTGLTYLMIDSVGEAEQYLSKAVSLSRQSGDYYTEALAVLNLASLEIKKENYPAAAAYLNSAQKIANTYSLTYLSGECEIIEGELNRKQKLFQAAKNNFEAALASAESVNEFNMQIDAYQQLAELHSEYNLNEAAQSYYQSAINIIENVSAPLYEEEDVQISWFSGRKNIYNSLADFYLQQKNFEKAFEVIDKSRSRSTVQNLKNLKLKNLVEDDSLISQIYDYEWMIHSGIYDKKTVDSVMIKLTVLKKNIAEKYPETKNYLYRDSYSNAKEIAGNLNKKENLVSIYMNEERPVVFLLNKKGFKFFQPEITAKEIRELVKKISPYYSSEKDSDNTFFNQDLFSFNSEAAHHLYTLVLKDALNEIPENEKIIIVPPVELISFPFELLVVNYESGESPYKYSGKDFLINHYSISYSPSAQLFINQKNNELKNDDKITILGDPAFNTSNKLFAERRSLLEENAGVPRSFALLPLKYSGEEVSEISDIINADQIFTNRNATETNFKLNAEYSRVIHLSTHSFLYDKQPVIFFSNIFDAENDGFLEAGEIVNLKLNSDLVVLSSCNSGLGKVDNAEGVLGMTKAFFEAGSKSVIVSLWEVNDRYTSKFMTLFYQKLQDGYDKSDALRLAKLEFIKTYSPNPYYWGAFVLSGDVSKLPLKSSTAIMPYIAGLIIIIFVSILAVYLYKKLKASAAAQTVPQQKT